MRSHNPFIISAQFASIFCDFCLQNIHLSCVKSNNISNKRHLAESGLANWLIKKSKPDKNNHASNTTSLDNDDLLPTTSSGSMSTNAIPNNSKSITIEPIPSQFEFKDQPKYVPSQDCDGRKFHFQLKWYDEFSWIHIHNGKMFCFLCTNANGKKLIKISGSNLEKFVKTGSDDWKHGKRLLQKHSNSDLHQEAIEKLALSQEPTIISVIDKSFDKRQKSARIALTSLFTSLQYLAKNGLAIQGGNESDGNYLGLLKLRSQDISELKVWLQRSKTFTHHDIQNEMIKIMAHEVLRKIIRRVGNSLFSLIVDETTDISTQEQVSICVRFVNEDFKAEEIFLGLYETGSTTAATLLEIILDSLMRFGLETKNLRGQCYDGARNMSGHISGVQTRIKELQPNAIFVHCFPHGLNLSVQETISEIPFVRDILGLVNEIGVALSGSAKRCTALKEAAIKISESLAPNKIKPLCPTRWTVRFSAINAILKQYGIIMETFKELGKDRDTFASKASGIYSKLEKANTYLGLLMCKFVFEKSDSLSKILQKRGIFVCGALQSAEVTLQLFREAQNDPSFYDSIWNCMENQSETLDLEPPTSPRARKIPPRFRHSNAEGQKEDIFPNEYYRSIFHKLMELICTHMSERFSQPGLEILTKFEDVVLNWKESKDDSLGKLTELCDKYYWNQDELINELNMFSKMSKTHFKSLDEGIEKFRSLLPETQLLFGGLKNVFETYLAVPVSSAEAERSFSMLRRLKTYLRSTMGQARLNHLCILNCYPEEVEDLDIEEFKNIFISGDFRTSVFGK